MRAKTRAMAAAAITSLALLATACGGGGGETPDPGTSEPAGQTGGEITVAGCTPENPLIPGNTSETCGGDIIDAMTSKLVEYNTENAAPENDIAESIETTDNKIFTVKLKPYKFHDGTDVKAKNFVDAWNYTAYGPNGQAGSYFYGPDRRLRRRAVPRRRTASRSPKAKTMSGLKVVDDTTFTITDLRAGVQPAGAAGLLRLRAAAGLLLRRPEGLREEADRRRAVQDGLDQQHRVRALQVRRLLRRDQGQRRQADLPDLPGPGGGLRRRRGRQPGLHRRQQHPAGPVRRRRVQERLPGPRPRSASRWPNRLDHLLARRSAAARTTPSCARPSRGPSTGI